MNCFLAVILLLVVKVLGNNNNAEEVVQGFSGSSAGHTNNWAVIVGASRFWFNYRHVANALSIYRSVKRMGIPDSQIILMLSDDMACEARNPWPATVFNNGQHHINVYGDDVEVDYRGPDVTVENLIRLLTGRVKHGTPRSRQLLTNSGSNILIYMTGHGGDGFLKFQDTEELTAVELAHAFEQMHQKQRYNEILFIIDTCQAESMSQKIYSPNIIGIGSSKVGEDSLSHHGDPTIGVYVIDRYTYYLLEFLEQYHPTTDRSVTTLSRFFDVCPRRLCISTVTVRTDLYERDPSRVPLSDFFGNVARLDLITYNRSTTSTSGPRESIKPQVVLESENQKQPEVRWTLVDPFPVKRTFL